MEKTAIVCDSCCDLTQELKEQYGIFVLPMVINEGEKSYLDGVDIQVEDVYQLQKDHELKTASPKGENIEALFNEIEKQGYTHVIVLALSSGLSGTYNQLRLYASLHETLTISVFDSRSGSIGYGGVAILLTKYRDAGYSYEQLLNKCEQLLKDCHVYFCIDDLIFLQKGGRIGLASAYVGTLMRIKPILSFDEESAQLTPAAKVRGRKKINAKFIELLQQHIEATPKKYVLLVADGGMSEEKQGLKQQLLETFSDAQDIIDTHVGATLSVYLGKGMLGAGIIFIDD